MERRGEGREDGEEGEGREDGEEGVRGERMRRKG